MTALPAAQAGPEVPQSRRETAQWVLEKLKREDGPTWERAGQYFLWNYRLQDDLCELEIRREAVDGSGTVTTRIPLADTVPHWHDETQLPMQCVYDRSCISVKVDDPHDLEGSHQLQRSQTQIMVMRPDDLPKLQDGLMRLHQLCDEPPA